MSYKNYNTDINSLSIHDLNEKEILLFRSEMEYQGKSSKLAYILLIAGLFGAHRFYLNKVETACAQVALSVLAVIAYIAMVVTSSISELEGNTTFTPAVTFSLLIFLATLLAIIIWLIVDLVKMPKMLGVINKEVEQQLIEKIINMRKQPE